MENTMTTSDKKRQDFDAIDVDGDGYITASELLTAAVKENPEMSDDEAYTIITMADEDGDSKISYEEYARFVR
jgi:Ca2+-binding EF-hand superfamily protein